MISKDIAKRAASQPPMDPIAEARRQWEHHGWADSAGGMAVVTTLVRANQIVTGMVEVALAPSGLSFARFEILRLLGFSRAGKLPMGKIGGRLQVHPASVTSAVKRLERDGLVRRRVDVTDSRVVLASITARGRDVVGRATDAVNAVFRRLDEEGIATEDLTRLLNRIRWLAGDTVAGFE